MTTLNRIHRQRIAGAVEAARRGEVVVIRVDPDGDSFPGARIAWFAEKRRHVIASGGEAALRKLIVHVQNEFQEQLVAAEAPAETGLVGKESSATGRA